MKRYIPRLRFLDIGRFLWAVSLALAVIWLLWPNHAGVAALIDDDSPPIGEVTLIAVADATVRSWEGSANFGDEHYLELSREQIDDETIHEAAILLRFDLSSLPDDAVIDSATMELFMGQATGPDPIEAGINFITNAWDESTVTWNTYLTTNPIGLAASIDAVTGDYRRWPVTGYARTWLNEPGTNFGILLRGPTSGPDYDRWFESHDHNERMPQLVIHYHLPPYEFSGFVYAGEPDDRSDPLGDAVVELWGDDDEMPDGGSARVRLDADEPTGADGAFNLTWTADRHWDYLHVIETDPLYAQSTGALAVAPGYVQSENVVTYRFDDLLEMGEHSFDGIAFWDRMPQGSPDLVVDDLHQDGSRICYIIENIASGVAAPGHVAALYVDGVQQTSTMIPFPMGLTSQWHACFDGFVWICAGEADTVAVVADDTNVVVESDETNNRREQEWDCDRTPPQLLSGPGVSSITPSIARITWETDEAANGWVRYGTISGQMQSETAGLTDVTAQEVLLTGLMPATTYHFSIESTDAAGNRMQSTGHLFETEPAPDSQDPTVRIIETGVISGTQAIQANADDDQGVDRVEFYLNGELVFTDFTPPYQWHFDSEEEENGQHWVEAKAFDLFGRSMLDRRSIETLNFADAEQPNVNIFHPHPGDNVYGETPIHVRASDDSGWSQVDWFVDGKKMGGGSFPIVNNLDIKFTWDTRFWSAGPHTVGVQATDGDGKTGADAIVVNVANSAPPSRPKLIVTAHEAFRHAHSLVIELTVENQGDDTARDVEIRDDMIGFQPYGRDFNGSDYLTRFDTTSRRSSCVIRDRLSYAPGDKRTYVCVTVPILLHPNPPTPSIGNTIVLEYAGSLGAQYQETTNFVIGTTTGAPGAWPREAVASAHANALTHANYLLVTSPNRLFNANPFQTVAVNGVLSDMSELAFEKDGVLAYMASPELTTLRNLIRDNGDWNWRLHSDFRGTAKGYLLIVGESEIIPAWRENRWTINWSNWACTTRVADISDLAYADTGGSDAAPELIVGRIIGNTPADLSTALRAGLDGSFDRAHALLVSGLDGNAAIQKTFTDSIDAIEKVIKSDFSVTKLHWSTIGSAQHVPQFRSDASGKDVILFRGHGAPDSWDSLNTTDFPGNPAASPPVPAIDFGSSNPVVLGMTCLSGSYENHVANGPCGAFGGGDDNIAEAFFDGGAAVFIGSTEVSSGNQNSAAAKAFFETWWKPNVTVGKALTDLKRARWSTTDAAAELWAYEYNLYGDPKYGAAPAENRSVQQSAQQDAEVAGPPVSIDVAVPDYAVTASDGFHDVDISGGDLMLEPGTYRIPYYRVRYSYPAGHQIQSVRMTDRSGMIADSGLKLRTNESNIDPVADRQMTAPGADLTAKIWTPAEEFTWRTTHDPDGTVILEISLYPFVYEATSTDVRFYKNYRFDVEQTVSPVSITATSTDKERYTLGETVAFEAQFQNSGTPQDVTVSAEIKKYPTGERVTGLPLRTYHNMAGLASFVRQWVSEGAEPGSYYVELTLQDESGQILDRRSQVVRIGVASAEITAFDVTPSEFDAGEPVSASLAFVNRGDLNLVGVAFVRVQDEMGGVVETFSQPFDQLRPAQTLTFDVDWRTSGVAEGTYAFAAHIQYSGDATDAVTRVVRSGSLDRHVFLPYVSR